jgi:hypothetical protein
MRTLVLSVLAAVLAIPGRADACLCMSSGPPCQAYFASDAVFVGTVTAIATRKVPLEGLPDQRFDRHFVQLAVERIGRGVQGNVVEVQTGVGGGDCGVDFKIGQRYVVYASRNTKDGSLGTGICSRTRLASEAAQDLAYLSAVPAAASGARISGTIDHWEHDPVARQTVKYGGVPDVQVLVRGQAGVFSGMTDAQGLYAIGGVPAGGYDVEVLPPPLFSTRYLSRKVEITDARACRVEDFSLHYAGRVAGTVVDASGVPLADVHVDIAPVNAVDDPLLLESSRPTDPSGRFELGDIPPGDYIVGVGLRTRMDQPTVYPRTLFPGTSGGVTAAAVAVGKGSRVDLGTLRLPEPSRRYELKGVVVGADGAPIGGALVYLTDERFRQASQPVKTAADGSFSVAVFEGRTYTARGNYNIPATTPQRQLQGTLPLVVSGPPAPIRLVLASR